MSDTKHELLLRALGPVADSAGKTLQNVWDAVFGGFDLYAQRKSVEREHALEEFKESFAQRVIEIPPSELKEPKISLLGPALEASKFYFEEESLREMFASCAAASMDKRKERDMHPSFPEIIKQMSPADAKNLSLFKTQLPVAMYYQTTNAGTSRRTVLTNVFLANKDEPDLELQSRSLSSLSRLGLLAIEYEQSVLHQKFYTDFFATPYFLELERHSKMYGDIPGVAFGIAKVTPLGKAFMSVCLGQ